MPFHSLSRRKFLARSAALASSTFVAAVTHAAPAPKYKMGLQLFTLNSIIGRDVTGTLKRVAAIGYQDCETYGFDPLQQTYYNIKAPAFRQVLADNQLITTSGHYDFAGYFDKPADDMKRFVDQCIEGAQAVGQRYITWPWLNIILPKIWTIG
jgi:sugar phosphate isomerase/epimerase